jgi:hypothetical protein
MAACGRSACRIGIKLVFKVRRNKSDETKGATVMFAVQSAFNQVGLAFMVAVISLGLLTLI